MAESETRDPLEVLAAEFAERQRGGETPNIEEYAGKYPHLADAIRELFPLVGAMEQARTKHGRGASGRATLDRPRPKQLGEYVIVREIGRGGMGIVYEARQESLDRRVALKVLPSSVTLDTKALARFQREARAIAKLNHPNIVAVYGIGEQDGLHYFAMQYVQGAGWDGLAGHLAVHAGDRQRPLSAVVRSLLGEDVAGLSSYSAEPYPRQVAQLARDAARALDHAHANGLLHRDIKPANLLLDADGRVYVSDFGLAKALHSTEATLSRDVAGTVRYMSPEQFDGQWDARSDVYSLGVTLYEMLTLKPAFDAQTQGALMKQVLSGSVAPPPPGCEFPPELRRIVARAMALQPGQRYPSAAALADDLEHYLRGEPLAARPAGTLAPWRLAALGAAAALILVGVAAFVLLRGDNRTQQPAEAKPETAAPVAAPVPGVAPDAVPPGLPPEHLGPRPDGKRGFRRGPPDGAEGKLPPPPGDGPWGRHRFPPGVRPPEKGEMGLPLPPEKGLPPPRPAPETKVE